MPTYKFLNFGVNNFYMPFQSAFLTCFIVAFLTSEIAHLVMNGSNMIC